MVLKQRLKTLEMHNETEVQPTFQVPVGKKTYKIRKGLRKSSVALSSSGSQSSAASVYKIAACTTPKKSTALDSTNLAGEIDKDTSDQVQASGRVNSETNSDSNGNATLKSNELALSSLTNAQNLEIGLENSLIYLMQGTELLINAVSECLDTTGHCLKQIDVTNHEKVLETFGNVAICTPINALVSKLNAMNSKTKETEQEMQKQAIRARYIDRFTQLDTEARDDVESLRENRVDQDRDSEASRDGETQNKESYKKAKSSKVGGLLKKIKEKSKEIKDRTKTTDQQLMREIESETKQNRASEVHEQELIKVETPKSKKMPDNTPSTAEKQSGQMLINQNVKKILNSPSSIRGNMQFKLPAKRNQIKEEMRRAEEAKKAEELAALKLAEEQRRNEEAENERIRLLQEKEEMEETARKEREKQQLFLNLQVISTFSACASDYTSMENFQQKKSTTHRRTTPRKNNVPLADTASTYSSATTEDNINDTWTDKTSMCDSFSSLDAIGRIRLQKGAFDEYPNCPKAYKQMPEQIIATMDSSTTSN